MAEEHVFLKVLDEIFQSQGQEIARYMEEVRVLKVLLETANVKLADMQKKPIDKNTITNKDNGAVKPPTGTYEMFNLYEMMEAGPAPSDVGSGPAESDPDSEGLEYPGGMPVEVEYPDGLTIKQEYDSDTEPFPSSEYAPGSDENDDNDTRQSNTDKFPGYKGNDNASPATSILGTDGDTNTVPSDPDAIAFPRPVKRRKRTGQTSFQCPFCEQTFSQWSPMKRRVILDNGMKVFTCRDCKTKHQLTKSTLAYKKSPSLNRPFKCEQCNKRFTQSSSLACHRRSHTGERPFSCAVCSRSFARSDYLKAHMKIHNDEKQHACAICHKEFRESRHLRYHLRMHHHMEDEAELDEAMAGAPHSPPDSDTKPFISAILEPQISLEEK